ncbi:four helix bundle protein [Marilutibacter alkalisoli]|uniref:Four helix bundle protein n=1 Tax=Marilutibacter alkalisoli TaxID=2591633 RepID=A0A514BTZ3_9GAMM|nr:four helix bundle protein [Lysobacter alkalisoli]QDH70881.1 four helix bundle protein [Lysobacter alkalisoli]
MTSRFQPPPIIKACERLLVDIEQAVGNFHRKYRYHIGLELRRQAMTIYTTANRAWRDTPHQRRWVEALVWEVDALKQHMQVAKLLRAFTSFRQFEHLARQAEGLGAQVGGWRKSFTHPHAQNAQARPGVVQRGQKLSTRAASMGANR